eukprot:5013329-Prymnesium_polylepis.1
MARRLGDRYCSPGAGRAIPITHITWAKRLPPLDKLAKFHWMEVVNARQLPRARLGHNPCIVSPRSQQQNKQFVTRPPTKKRQPQ